MTSPISASRWPVMLNVVTGNETATAEESEGLLGKGGGFAKEVGPLNKAMALSGKSWSMVKEGSSILAKRLYYSKVTGLVYGVVLAANVFVLVRGIMYETVDVYLVGAECFVTFMLTLEVVLRMLMQGCAYFHQKSNLFDFVVMLICLFLLITSPDLWIDIDTGEGYSFTMEDAEDILEQLLVATRFVVQIVRTATLVLHQRRSKLPEEGVDFTQLHKLA